MNLTFEHKRLFGVTILLLWCIALVIGRLFLDETQSCTFLLWNLFLAFIPLMAAAAFKAVDIKNRGILAATWFVIWLLFLPNAPYILTDLIHFRQRPFVPLWFDLCIFLSCAGTGLWLGYLSLIDVHVKIERDLGPTAGWAAAIGSLLLSGFGIYLGRFLRWNSWEALTNPGGLLLDITAHILDPKLLAGTAGVTIIFGTALTLGYMALRITATAAPPLPATMDASPTSFSG